MAEFALKFVSIISVSGARLTTSLQIILYKLITNHQTKRSSHSAAPFLVYSNIVDGIAAVESLAKGTDRFKIEFRAYLTPHSPKVVLL